MAEASRTQRAIERLVLRLGRPMAVYIILFFAAAWIAVNLVLQASGRAPFDPPPFNYLEGLLSLAALLMTIVILTSENRLSEIEERRAHLHLQVSLLAERKIAKVVQLLEELRIDIPEVPDREDREAQAFTLPADPHEVAAEIERRSPERGEVVEG